jgi:hypothetical protein
MDFEEEERQTYRHRIFVVPLPLESPPSDGDQRATDAAAVQPEEAMAEPAAAEAPSTQQAEADAEDYRHRRPPG